MPPSLETTPPSTTSSSERMSSYYGALRKALFHWYSDEGMDMRDCTENESNMNELGTMMPLL